MKARLESRMQGWEAGERAPRIEPPDHTPVSGVYLVNKADVNQGRVSMGHLGIQLGNPDEYAIDLMNDILGSGSSFTSRILGRVRSDEGLAYSAGSSFSVGAYYPGTFRAAFESKSRTCAQAAQIILEEIERIRTEKVTREELETARNYAVEIFPRFFSSARAVAGTFATDELIGRDPDYWTHYRDRLKKITAEDVLRVAREYLHPERMVILAVGEVGEMLKGNPDRPEYSFQKLAPDGEITMIPLPDPATMVYPDS
jgi:predicted Zn-dependent peptidase